MFALSMLMSDSEVSPNLDVFSAPLLQSHSAAAPLNADCLDWFSGGGAAELRRAHRRVNERASERASGRVACHLSFHFPPPYLAPAFDFDANSAFWNSLLAPDE